MEGLQSFNRSGHHAPQKMDPEKPAPSLYFQDFHALSPFQNFTDSSYAVETRVEVLRKEVRLRASMTPTSQTFGLNIRVGQKTSTND